LPDRTP